MKEKHAIENIAKKITENPKRTSITKWLLTFSCLTLLVMLSFCTQVKLEDTLISGGNQKETAVFINYDTKYVTKIGT